MMESIDLKVMNSKLIDGIGSYCLRSQKYSNGYQKKNEWLHDSFEQNLKYVQCFVNNKVVGFIEYVDSEYSSRVVYAEGFIIIHCLWVSDTGKGYGAQLVNKCIEDARIRGKKGVAVVTNEETSWVVSKALFHQHGFKKL